MKPHNILVAPLVMMLVSCATATGPSRIESVETDHGGNPSDVSTDEIFLKYTDGSRKYLTRNSLMDRAATFSHDNSRIAFVRRVDSNGDGRVTWADNSQLVIMDLADKTTEIVSEGLNDAGMGSWHSDKLELVFDALQGKKRKLFAYDIRTRKRRTVASDVSSPELSFDGQFIAFYVYENEGSRAAVIRADGSDRRIITDDVGNGWGLCWTYGGSLIFPYNSGKELRRYDPKSKKLEPADIRTMKSQRPIDQSKYDWARKTRPAKGTVQPNKAIDGD